jgi:UDPglucose--hexose-1-phosphate uridylyltransferase
MSEFRKDLVSGDWVIVATGRSKRLHAAKKAKRVATPLRDCPFEHPDRTGNWPPLIQRPLKGKWRAILIQNKFPALNHEQLTCPVEIGPEVRRRLAGVGHHDLLVTRNHHKSFPDLTPTAAAEVLEIFQERYCFLQQDPCIEYATAFCNWGTLAGASVYHPHYQLLATPVTPPEVNISVKHSARHYKKNNDCIHCLLISSERKAKVRIVAENTHAIAIAPYASKHAYEVRVFPKHHRPFFEQSGQETIRSVAGLLRKVLRRMRTRLGDPDYNFFVHSAPLKNQQRYTHYHWHVEIMPRNPKFGPGGFELSTGMYVNQAAPEDVAKLLKT